MINIVEVEIAKSKIGGLIENIMRETDMDPSMMLFVLESVTNDVARMKNMQDAISIAQLLKRGDSNGDSE